MSTKLKLARAFVRALRPDPVIGADEWARINRVMPADAVEPGPYRPERTPYMIDVQRTMSATSSWREGWLMKGTQLGGSVAGENLIGSWICTAAGNILVAFDGLENAKTWELTRFEPMRESCKPLRKLIRSANVKGADNTKLRKKFSGGTLRLIGAKAMPKSTTYRYVKVEEPDEIPWDVDGQGSFFEGLRARVRNFGRKAKMYGDSSPTIEGASHIEREFLRGDQRQWHLFCPGCGHPQHLRWEQMKCVRHEAIEDTAASTRYQCEADGCGFLGTEADWKLKNYARRPGMSEEECRAEGIAHWQATIKGQPAVASWQLPSMAAPIGWAPWPLLMTMWLEVGDDEDKRKSFRNNVQGLTYSYKQTNELNAKALAALAENYPLGVCPAKGLVLVAGVDTQDNRLHYVIRTYGRGEESWGVARGELYGDTSQPEVWNKLHQVLSAGYTHASGQSMLVDVAFIDAGGHRTENVKAFCRDAQLRGKHWCATFGARDYAAPPISKPRNVEFNWQGKAIAGGATVRFVGTQGIKNLLDGRLKLGIVAGSRTAGAGVFHTPLGFEEDYYEQMRSEHRQLVKDKNGNKVMLWQRTGATRNEDWDCEVLAYGAYLYAMQGRHAEAVFKDRERLFAQARQGDLLDEMVSATVESTPAPVSQSPDRQTETQEQLAPDDGMTAQEFQQARQRLTTQVNLKRPRKSFVRRF
ncbi:MAG: terminase gpA endonuclease subunit [Burkholderiaceae bacterium]